MANEVIDAETGEVSAAPIATVAPATLAAPTQSRAVTMRAFIAAETEIRGLVKEYVKLHMVEGDDFGVIPGTPKPTLLKPGAEKLVDLFNVEPDYVVASRVEDWDRGLFHYEVKVTLRERISGVVRAIGLGSANSREGRYRWRNGERVCPGCGKPTIIKGKAEYGGGFVCFAKKGGCGAKFRDDDATIVDQQVGKVENDDIYTLVNTILKMAKKRALVDGAIALARCSDIFTQDVEDLPQNDEPRQPIAPRAQKAAPSAKAKEAPRIPYGDHKGKTVDDPSVPHGFLADFMEPALAKSINDPTKSRFKTSNEQLLKAVRAELARREAAFPRHDAPAGDNGWDLDNDAREAAAEAFHAQHD